MNKLSERVEIIINLLVEKVNSMHESPKDCVTYTNSIAELYSLLNKISRAEVNVEIFYQQKIKEKTDEENSECEQRSEKQEVIKNNKENNDLFYNYIKLKDDEDFLDKYNLLISNLENELNVEEYLLTKEQERIDLAALKELKQEQKEAQLQEQFLNDNSHDNNKENENFKYCEIIVTTQVIITQNENNDNKK